jgi:peptidyl-prolyl cis-trans isomerase A (cyclophilin A)
MKPFLLIAIVAGVILGQTKSDTSKAAPKTPAKAAPKAGLLDPGSLKAVAPATYRVKMTTTKGDILVDVTREWAPRGADRFYNLVRAGFFTDAAFFRVLPGFVVQFGLGPRPDVNRVWETARIFDDPVKHSNKRGTLTFATAGPNTRTTQLFINLADNVGLDTQGFSPFGEVVEGMNIVQALNPEYREQPDQGRIREQGKAYLDKSFPRLDRIVSASIVPAAAPAAAPAAKQ